MRENTHMTTTPSDVIRYLLPFVATAGSYSSYIQGRVGKHAAKDGATAFHQALSDADLTIQSYLEVVLLARFPELSFFSEEQDQSLNAKYFAPDGNLEVLLDPIDGTRSYIDNRPHYQIIVAIHDRSELVGALAYMPRQGVCYIATKGEGAYVLTHEEARIGHRGTRLRLTQKEGPILVFNKPDLCAKLAPYFEIRDVVVEYDAQPGRYNFTNIFDGSTLANVSQPCQGIDGGALSFIAQEAGALATDFSGNPMGNFRLSPKRIVPETLVTANPEAHEKILKVLQAK
jgi:fructose-1,6-bisphosphatase/inositol monophosphatase family enzyme